MNVVAPIAAQSNAPRVERWPLAKLGAIMPQWRALAARALEPNVFYEPAFALPAAALWGEEVGANLVWSHTDRLLGLFPLRAERRYGLPPSVLTGWTHPYGPLGTPLVDRDDPAGTILAWLDHLAADAELPWLVLLPLVPEQGLFAAALDAALAQRPLLSALFGRHRRAVLAPGDDRAGYVERTIGAKKRKELRRQRNRLADLGTLKVESTTQAPRIDDALADFLELEALGWKGRAGTAAANNDAIRRFIDDAISGLAAERQARIDRLRIGLRTIAAVITLHSGDRAWTWKIAYDEEFGRSSPGVQLMIDITDSLLADQSIAHVDSCATADHPMIDHLWGERLALSDRLIALRPTALPFALACRLETLRRSGFAVAKGLRDRLRPRA
jgi:CelD/BcsL family acetyltransferase involved in cellulose biosynthesis